MLKTLVVRSASRRVLGAAFCGSVFAAPAFAGTPSGGITFGPVGAASVPALGSAALVLLALLLGFIGWVSLRKQGPGSVSAITLSAAVLAAGGAGGLRVMGDAQATGAFFAINNPAGQTLSLLSGQINEYNNTTSIPMQPTSINLGTCALQTTAQTCTLNKAIAAGGSCELDCTGVVVSDARLKADVKRVATAANGLPVYEYRYAGNDVVYRGVMAQDVLFHTPAAVHMMSNGYLAVDYRMLGLQLERLR